MEFIWKPMGMLFQKLKMAKKMGFYSIFYVSGTNFWIKKFLFLHFLRLKWYPRPPHLLMSIPEDPPLFVGLSDLHLIP